MATDTKPHIILLQTRAFLEHEGYLADDTKPITPGMLLEISVAGGYGGGARPGLIPLATGGAFPTQFLVATEFSQIGRGINDAYTVENEVVPYYEPIRGEHLYMLLGAGGNVADGAVLESKGDGSLQAVTDSGIVRALEAINNSAGTAPVHIRVEVL